MKLEQERHEPTPHQMQNELRLIMGQLPKYNDPTPEEKELMDEENASVIWLEKNDPDAFYRELEVRFDETTRDLERKNNSEHRKILVEKLQRLVLKAKVTNLFKETIIGEFNARYGGSTDIIGLSYLGVLYETFPGYLTEEDDPDSMGIFDKDTARRIERRQYWTEFLHNRHFLHNIYTNESAEKADWVKEKEAEEDSTTGMLEVWSTEFAKYYGEQV